MLKSLVEVVIHIYMHILYNNSFGLFLAFFKISAPVILLLFNANPLDISYAKSNPRFAVILEFYYPGQVNEGDMTSILIYYLL